MANKYHMSSQDCPVDIKTFEKQGSICYRTNRWPRELFFEHCCDNNSSKIVEENFDYVFYIAGVDIHFNDRLGKLKISDDGIRKRDEIVTENFFSKGVPLCGVLGGGYNKDFNKLVELHSILHQSCAKLL